MKRYINSTTKNLTNNLTQGAYLLTRTGEIFETVLHVPSTTYISRGIEHLCPTDAEFLLNNGKISEDEAELVLKYCLVEYLTTEFRKDTTYIMSIFDVTSFTSYADLRYAPILRKKVLMYPGKFKNFVTETEANAFARLNRKWYNWLKNNFVKMSVFRNVIEFRICSEDNYDWNEVIINYGILGISNSNNPATRYTIVRESSKGYKAYFINATLDEVLENDNVILSSILMRRYVVGGNLTYNRKL